MSCRVRLYFELFLSKDLEFAIFSLADLRFPPGLFIWNACRDLFRSLQNNWNFPSFIRSLWWCNDYNEVQNWKGFFCPLTYSLHEISRAAFGTPSEFLTTWERNTAIEHNSCFLPRWSIFNPLPQVFFTFLLLHDLLNLFFFFLIFLNPHSATDLCFAILLHFSAYKKDVVFSRIFIVVSFLYGWKYLLSKM